MSEPIAAKPQEQRLVTVSPGRPPYPVRAQAAFGISPGDWRALVDAVYPTAKTTEAIELALTYCRARKLDPFKRQCHIVPIWDSKQGREIETIWPGISELRTTAARTGQHAGFDEAVFGPEETRVFKGTVGKGQYAKEVEKTVSFPMWCQITAYRMLAGQRVAFPGPKVRWLETYATMGASDVPNEMWASRPYGQLEKCAEAAALRRAFPEEVGSEYIPEEVGRSRSEPIDITPAAAEPLGARTEALAERLGVAREAAALDARVAAGEIEEGQRSGPDPGVRPMREPSLAPIPSTTLNLSRDQLVEAIRQALAGNFTPEQKDLRADALELAFGTRSWVSVTRMAPEDLRAGLHALETNLRGLEAMKSQTQQPAEREPGEDAEEVVP